MYLPRKVALVLCLLFICSPLFAQRKVEKVDREEIKRAISDPALSTYYSKLVARFNLFDTSLTNADFRYLYFGYVFQKGYDGFGHLTRDEVTKAEAAKDFSKALTMADSALAINPVSLWANYRKAVILS